MDYQDFIPSYQARLYTTKSASAVMEETLGRNPLESQDLEQITGDILHMYGWVADLTAKQEAYVVGEQETIGAMIYDGKSLDEITRYLFLRMPKELGKIVMRETFSEHYKPVKGSHASREDTQIILARTPQQIRKAKKEISQGSRATLKEINNIRVKEGI